MRKLIISELKKNAEKQISSLPPDLCHRHDGRTDRP